jgi:hypothetical protein
MRPTRPPSLTYTGVVTPTNTLFCTVRSTSCTIVSYAVRASTPTLRPSKRLLSTIMVTEAETSASMERALTPASRVLGVPVKRL